MKRLLLAALAIAGIGMLAPAQATPSLMFVLDQNGCSGSGGCGTGPYGTVTVTQGADQHTVLVTETLASGVEFVKTGAGQALEFNILNNPNITITGLTNGFSVGPAPATASTFGQFDYSISCSGCGNGASSPLPGPLTFTTTDGTILTPDSFVANSGGYFFASDIIGTNGGTGNVATRGPVPAPEPMSLALLGGGLIGLGMVRRRSC